MKDRLLAGLRSRWLPWTVLVTPADCHELDAAPASALARAAWIVVTWTPLPASQVRVSIIDPPPPIMPPRPAVRAAPGAVEGTVYDVG